MDVRRCAIVVVQPTEQIRFEFEGLLRGGDGLVRTLAWEALAPTWMDRWCWTLRHRHCWEA